MKLNFTLFGVEIQMEVPGYTWVITSERDGSNEPHTCQLWEEDAFFYVARFKAWRLARMYARHELRDQHIFIYSNTKVQRSYGPIFVRHINIKKTVPFFSSKK